MIVDDELPAAWSPAVSLSFLGRMPPSLQRTLLAHARAVTVEPRTILYYESPDTDATHLALILTGLLRVYRTSRAGREVTLRYARKGDVLGLPSIVLNRSPAGAQAVVRSEVLFLSTSTFRSSAHENSQLAWAMAEEMAGSLFNIQERLAHNVFAPVRGRVARYLIDIAEADGGCLVAKASHEEIAYAIGSVREVVARTFSAMRDDGLIRRTTDGILIVDANALSIEAQSDEFQDFRTRH